MGIQDRDYWRNRYNRMTGHKDRIDPTHWREDELRTSYPFARRDSTDSSVEKTLKTWTKVFIFLVTAVVMGIGLQAWERHKALKQLEAIAMQAHADLRLQQQIAAERALDAARKVQAQKDAERRKLAQRIEQRELAERNARAETDWRGRKEAAWLRYYKPSPSCQRDAATVDCANEHIRSQRAFDAQYKG